jgi:hypothetical protein
VTAERNLDHVAAFEFRLLAGKLLGPLNRRRSTMGLVPQETPVCSAASSVLWLSPKTPSASASHGPRAPARSHDVMFRRDLELKRAKGLEPSTSSLGS